MGGHGPCPENGIRQQRPMVVALEMQTSASGQENLQVSDSLTAPGVVPAKYELRSY